MISPRPSNRFARLARQGAALGLALAAASCGDTMDLWDRAGGSGPYGGNSANNSFNYDIRLEVKRVDELVHQGQRFALDVRVRNNGQNALTDPFLVSVFLSPVSVFDIRTASWLASLEASPLDSGEVEILQREVTVPGGFETGDYYVFLFADAAEQYAEVEERDNLHGPWPLEVLPAHGRPDLEISSVVSALDPEATIVFNNKSASIPLAVTVANRGTAALYREFYSIRYELAPINGGPYVSAGSSNNWSIPDDFALPFGAAQTLVGWPDLRDAGDLANGWYFLRVTVDSGDSIIETDEDNNAFEPLPVRVKDY